MSLTPSTRLGPYEIVAPLGAGGMGEVYRAKDTRLDRQVAVKVLPMELASTAMRERFDREARAVSQLEHPHICRLYDVGHHDGTDYLVMELLEGETLAERLKRGPMDLDEVLEHAIQIAEALDKAHRQGVIHRDLKPGNIMLTKSGAKLLDFGLAKLSLGAQQPIAGLTSYPTEHKNLTQEGTILGTFQYMAPEQLEGEEADARTDIFALGAVLYEMTTGRRAFEGKTKTSLIAAIVDRDPTPISTLQPMTPPALEHVIRKCLEKDPDRRWQSAADIASQLRWISDLGSQAGVAAPVIVRRKRREWIAWSLAAVSLVAAVALGALLYRHVAAQRRQTAIRSAILTPDNVRLNFFGASAPPAISPNGKLLVFGAQSGGKNVLWLRPLHAQKSQEIPDTTDAIFPFWSPDSRWIAFFADGRLKKVSVSGGAAVALCEVPDGRGGSWSQEGTIIFAARYSPIMKVSAAGGRPAAVTAFEGKDTTHRWPKFLPDGKHFLYTATPTSAEDPEGVIALGSIDRKMRKVIVRTASNAEFVAGHILFVLERVLMAQQFNARKLEPVGEPFPLQDQIQTFAPFSRSTFTVSNNGTLVYHPAGTAQDSQLVWVDRSGKQIGTVSDVGPYVGFDVSADGAFVVSTMRGAPQNLWLFDLKRGVKTRLTFGQGRDVGPVYSPDGKKLAYASTGSNRNNFLDIYVRDMTTGATERLMNTEEDEIPFSWSSDGQIIFYTVVGRGRNRSDIEFVDLAERKRRVYLQTEFAESLPAISPDGKWIAYASAESSPPQVYVAPFPATGAKWQVSNSGGGAPWWRADQKELFYMSADRQLMAVPITLATSPQIGQPVALFSLRADVTNSYAATRDGQRFIIHTRSGPEAPPSPLTLVEHFDAELRAAAEQKSE